MCGNVQPTYTIFDILPTETKVARKAPKRKTAVKKKAVAKKSKRKA